jgi:hypothetical protein
MLRWRCRVERDLLCLAGFGVEESHLAVVAADADSMGLFLVALVEEEVDVAPSLATINALSGSRPRRHNI